VENYSRAKRQKVNNRDEWASAIRDAKVLEGSQNQRISTLKYTEIY
jgi:hypothetical protein